jgi:hypothetical protein
MNESKVFSHDRFLSLAGCELVKYAEPFLTTQAEAIPGSVYETLQSQLADMDEEHAVYALEICMRLKPSEFVSRAVTFLSHTDAAVCSTAYRLINSLPPNLIPADLVEKIAATPTVALFAPDVRSGERIRIGTNEEFIRDLVSRFAIISNKPRQ